MAARRMHLNQNQVSRRSALRLPVAARGLHPAQSLFDAVLSTRVAGAASARTRVPRSSETARRSVC